MIWICTGVAFGMLLYWLFAPREEEVILLGHEWAIEVDNN